MKQVLKAKTWPSKNFGPPSKFTKDSGAWIWDQEVVSLQMLTMAEGLTWSPFMYANLGNPETFAVMFWH